MSIFAAILRPVLGAARSLTAAVPWWGWSHAAALAVGAGAVVFAHGSAERPDVQMPTIKRAGPVDTSAIRADIWRRLQVHTAPAPSNVDTTMVALPAWMTEGLGRGRNALPTVRYEAPTPQLGDVPTVPRLPFVAVPMRGARPAVDVGPDEVVLRAANPRTAEPLTYTYAVPSPTWTLSAAGTIGAASASVSGASALVLERAVGDWTIGASGGYGLTVSARTVQPGWQAGVTIERTLLEWSW